MSDSEPVIAFPVPPVVKHVRVRLSREEAFRRFTEQIADWWPLRTLSVSRREAATCAIERRVGGRAFERDVSGAEFTWGIVESWAPPGELALRWFAGRDETQAQHLLVRFEDAGEGETDVTLTHSGWEKLGAEAEAVRASYDSGWQTALLQSFGGSFRKERDDA